MVFRFNSNRLVCLASLAALAVGVASCAPTTTTTEGTPGATPAAAGGSPSNLSGSVVIDGSSTVFPIAEAMAEDFQKANPGVKVTVSKSGTGGGFKKFCAGETDISNASRPIKKEEIELCEKGKVEFVELPISFDGLSVVANPANDWATCLTVDELKKIWEPAAQGKVTKWNQINPKFPDAEMKLYGPGTDSGTFDYFTKAIVGEEGSSRGDYTASEDDNVLVQGIAGDKNALGYFGYAYYEENKDKLKLVQIDNGKGCVAPAPETIVDGTYQPLSRPEFFYVKKEAASRPEVQAFVKFQLAAENKGIISEVGYVPLSDDILQAALGRFEKGVTGTVFADGSAVGVKLADLLKKEK